MAAEVTAPALAQALEKMAKRLDIKAAGYKQPSALLKDAETCRAAAAALRAAVRGAETPTPYRAKTSEHEILEAMERFGGGFVVQLSRCFRAADKDNRRILLDGFRHYFAQYDEMAAAHAVPPAPAPLEQTMAAGRSFPSSPNDGGPIGQNPLGVAEAAPLPPQGEKPLLDRIEKAIHTGSDYHVLRNWLDGTVVGTVQRVALEELCRLVRALASPPTREALTDDVLRDAYVRYAWTENAEYSKNQESYRDVRKKACAAMRDVLLKALSALPPAATPGVE